MSNQQLLEKLKKLREIDNALSFDNQNPKIYRQRALLFQGLGCDSLAQYDNRICAYLENKTDIEYYNRNYQAVISKDFFAKIYQLESHTHYYKVFFDILQNDADLLKAKIDPIHFALRSGNATLLGLFNLALRDCNDAMKYLVDFKREYAIATLNKALLLLLVGDYTNGWQLYESRWETDYKTFKNPIVFPRTKWQEKLPLVPNKMKVGVVWRGGFQTDTDKVRSIPISLFSKLFSLNAAFYVLQKDVNDDESEILKHALNVDDLHSELASFSDTSAIIEQMDLVICVDTSIAHLAAVMGKPMWILNPAFAFLHSRKSISKKWVETLYCRL